MGRGQAFCLEKTVLGGAPYATQRCIRQPSRVGTTPRSACSRSAGSSASARKRTTPRPGLFLEQVDRVAPISTVAPKTSATTAAPRPARPSRRHALTRREMRYHRKRRVSRSLFGAFASLDLCDRCRSLRDGCGPPSILPGTGSPTIVHKAGVRDPRGLSHAISHMRRVR